MEVEHQWIQRPSTITLLLSKIYRQSLSTFYRLKLESNVRNVRRHGKPVAFIMGTPDHPNLGDQAILQAENDFIQTFLPTMHAINVPLAVIMHGRKDMLTKLVTENDVLLGHGGGNLGDTYMGEELCRRNFIRQFPNNKIVIFPQTIYFSDTLIGHKELQKTESLYAEHKQLTLIAREQTSYTEMLRVFPKNKVLLTPDIVLSLNRSAPAVPREGMLLCLRNDIESKLSKKDRQTISLFGQKNFTKITNTDTVSSARLFALRSKKRAVASKLNEFKRAQFVVTDRLHGMVFAAITGTPCVALTNFNHKVKGTYKWLEHLPYIKFCDNVAELDGLLTEIDVNSVYEYDPAYYSKYWQQISQAITGH